MLELFTASLPIAGLLSGNPYIVKMKFIVGIAVFASLGAMFLEAIGAGGWSKFLKAVGLLTALGITIDLAVTIYNKL